MSNLDKSKITAAILKFAQENHLQIHPGQEVDHWGDLIMKHNGACPCVRNRPKCPCEFALEDIKEIGRCRCGLFANDAFVREYNLLISQHRRRK